MFINDRINDESDSARKFLKPKTEEKGCDEEKFRINEIAHV